MTDTTTDQAGTRVEVGDFVRYHGSQVAKCPVTVLKVEFVREDGRMDLVHDGAHPFHVRRVRSQSVTLDHAPVSGVNATVEARQIWLDLSLSPLAAEMGMTLDAFVAQVRAQLRDNDGWESGEIDLASVCEALHLNQRTPHGLADAIRTL